MITNVDADFLALPLDNCSNAAITAAKAAGALHVDVRIERTRSGYLSLRDAKPETQTDETNFGIGVQIGITQYDIITDNFSTSKKSPLFLSSKAISKGLVPTK